MPDHPSCELASLYVCTPIGSMVIKSCSQGLHVVCQSETIDDSNFDEVLGKCPTLKHDIDPKQLEINHPIISECVQWLTSYFNNPEETSSLQIPKLCPTLTTENFHSRVWVMLAQQVGPGKTMSYKELAEMVKSPGAARAVGSAMAANPFQIVVPCHRVLPSSGKLGNYACGKKNKVKAWLLQHEGVTVHK